jgi:ABC-type lipoprotein export system ATPase subunit
VTTTAEASGLADQQADLVRCDGATRVYGARGSEFTALHATTCRVRPTERIALTGPSGSGKSTLLHLLSGLDRPSSGRVSWPGLGGDPAQRAGLIGIVFQGPSLLPPLDVAENVALPLVLAGVPQDEARRRAAVALDQTDTAALAGQLPEELSGGQAQRVAVARVLAMRPKLILADEPTGQLDAAHREQIVKVLLEVAEQLGAGLVISTHDPLVACHLDQEWRLLDGRLMDTDRNPAHVPLEPAAPALEDSEDRC